MNAAISCVFCRETSPNDYLFGTNHWPIPGEDICIAMRLTRSHVIYATKRLEDATPARLDDARQQLIQDRYRASQLWSHRPPSELHFLGDALRLLMKLDRIMGAPAETHEVVAEAEETLFGGAA